MDMDPYFIIISFLEHMLCRGMDMDDAIADMEAILDRTQEELGGQVGSYRLQGPKHRFTGRTSVVAFADGMWGGQFALKFYCEPDAAKREFAIYQKATVRPRRPCLCLRM